MSHHVIDAQVSADISFEPLYSCFPGFLGILQFLEPQSPHFTLELRNQILKYQEILNFLLIHEN
jgi:hypothetical protein